MFQTTSKGLERVSANEIESNYNHTYEQHTGPQTDKTEYFECFTR